MLPPTQPYKEIDRQLRKNTNNSLSVSNQDLNNNLSNNQGVEKSSNNLIHAHEVGQRGKNLSKGYYIFFVAMIVVIVTFEVANEVSAITFLPAVLKNTPELKLDNEHAGYVFSILQFAIAGARFANIFLSFKVNTVANLYFNFICMTVGTVILMIFLNSSLMLVEIGIGFLGRFLNEKNLDLVKNNPTPSFCLRSWLQFNLPAVDHICGAKNFADQSSQFDNGWVLFAGLSFMWYQKLKLTYSLPSPTAFSSVFGLSITPFIISNAIDSHPNNFTYITFGLIVLTVAFFTILYVMEVLRLRKT